MALAPQQDAAPTPSLLDSPDWAMVGLILAIVGSFLLANAILFRDPRAMVQEHFSRVRTRLRTIREFIFHRVQMTLGFGFLMTGFAVQMVGRLNPVAAEDAVRFPVLWIGGIVFVAIGLEVFGWWWAQRSFRRYVARYFRANKFDFSTDMATAREVGELFGMKSDTNESVQSYVVRLRTALGLGHEVGPDASGEERGYGGLHDVHQAVPAVPLGEGIDALFDDE